MIPTLLRIAFTTLRRDRVVQMSVFLLPIVFFTIFAAIFRSQTRGVTAGVRAAVVDEDHSEASRRIVAALAEEKGLRVRTAARPEGAPRGAAEVPLDRARALALVKAGDVPVAIVIPAGFGAGFGAFESRAAPIELLSDSSDPVAPQVVSGLLQRIGMTAAPDLFEKLGFSLFERYGGPMTGQQREAMRRWTSSLTDTAPAGPGRAPGRRSAAGDSLSASIVPVRIVDVLGDQKRNPVVALTAAGIAVMFLLFSASSAGGALLDEVESGTLERLLTSRAGMGTILAGKWLYVTLLGVFQVTVMFVWGMAVFQLDLMHHLPGFFIMTFFTAAAAAGFGLVLATLCRTRQQLGGVSTILILSQSAVGGSMFPRFIMSEGLRAIGRFTTFNANALDGYEKVFWREAPLTDLWPQVLVLAILTVVFLAIARALARRWEST
ncbi:MAG: ABC transporter permease [Candidatus Eisenbacteria bacterium]|uniref:ABC transporter permease n=1 Tax=Eiseniibacteriota bacterium TaxID=2212470 RepID=A0A9D6QMQ4_UNCEI|nr:ABC transporter permease [Candidatus Eisenbacteria bacterium]MBI3540008.1 ABC transporter permease [Candidatus Eisenbacteria bacterium]